MKATITLKNGTVITGKLDKIDGSRLTFDATLNAQLITELSQAGCSVSELPFGGDWYVIARFEDIEKYEITD
jgi:hypothetical protein